MKFRNLYKWSLSESLEGLVFLAQRLDELLYEYTLDSYKPAALNAPFLCIEALEIIRDIENETIDEAHLVNILDELKWAISTDPIAKKVLDAPLDQYLLNTQEPLHKRKLRMEVLSKTLGWHKYFSACCTFLKEAVVNKQKKNIDLYAKTLISTLINLGISKTFLREKTHEFFYEGEEKSIISVDILDAFFDIISPRVHHFDVYFVVSNDVKIIENSIRPFSIEIIDTLPEDLRAFATANSFIAKENETLVLIDDIETFDAYTARKMAERRIDMLKDMLTIFSHKNDLRWRDNTLIVQCCTEQPTIVGRPRNSMEKSNDMHTQRASKRLNWMLSEMAFGYHSDSFEKFNRIVDLHGICVSNEIPENQLLNLWISIETLVPSQSGKNKINNILSSLDPIIRATYVTRLINQALADLLYWNSTVTSQILRKVPDANHTKAAVRLLQLLALDSNFDLREDLYKQLKDFHLLRFRLYTLAEKLKNPDNVLDLINSHSKKVAWQLRRLYRTRNLLVHTGRTPSYLPTLIENGHDYLDLALNQIMERTCGEYKVTTIEQAFEIESLLEKNFTKSLKSIKNFNDQNIRILYMDTAQHKQI